MGRLALGVRLGLGPHGHGTGTPTPTPLWSAAKAAVLAGTRNAKITCVGDSITAGFGANAANAGSNGRSAAWPKIMADALTTGGLRGSWQSLVGKSRSDAASNPVSYPSYDNRVTLGTGWDASTSLVGLGEKPFANFANTGTTFAFTPTTSVDTFEIVYLQTVNGSAFSYAIDAGTPVNVNATGTLGLFKITVSGSLGAHTLNIVRNAGGTDNVRIYSVIAYNSAQKEVSVLNAGWIGGTAAQAAAAVNIYDPANMLNYQQPDLTIISLTTNDAFANTDPTAYKASIQTLITKAKLTGDAILAITAQSDPAATPQIRQDAFAQYMLDLSTLNGLVSPIDFRVPLGATYSIANAAGYMRDNTHPNASGYNVMGQYAASRILAL